MSDDEIEGRFHARQDKLEKLQLTPYQRLAARMIQQCVADLTTDQAKQEADSWWGWIYGPSTSSTFEVVCASLDLDPEIVRIHIESEVRRRLAWPYDLPWSVDSIITRCKHALQARRRRRRCRSSSESMESPDPRAA